MKIKTKLAWVREVFLPPVVLILLLPGLAASQQADIDRAAAIDHIVMEQMQKQQAPTVTIAVAQNGRVFYSQGFGTADLENAVPATAETLIRTGSLAKPLTAVAAMTLFEAGKLDLDAPIQKYCPAFPQKQWPITTRELLNHTSGIRHYKGDNEIGSTKHFSGMSDGFTIFAGDPLLFEPGTKFNYSTYGYTVAGCVIEGASGEKFYDYLREHVLAPAGMTHTFVDAVSTLVPHRARGYTQQDGQVKNAGLMDSSYKVPGGGLVSTAEDFVRFSMALMDHKILKSETLELMWTPSNKPQLEGGKPSPYGLGFGVTEINGEKRLGHSGGQQGTSTVFTFYPARHFAIAVFANQDTAQPFDIVRPVLELYQVPQPAQ